MFDRAPRALPFTISGYSSAASDPTVPAALESEDAEKPHTPLMMHALLPLATTEEDVRQTGKSSSML